MGKKAWAVIAVVILVVGVVAMKMVTPGQQSSVIKLGVILPLTGPGAPYGVQVMDGVSLALKQAASQGLIKPSEVKLIVEDDRTDVAQGVNAINKLRTADGVKIIIGALASSVTLACAPIAEQYHILLLSPGSSSDEISNAGDYIFRIAPTDSYDGKFLAKAMFDSYGIKTVSALYLNNDFGSGLMKSFLTSFEAVGGKVVASQSYAMGATDFRTQLTQLKSAKADAFLLIAAGNENVIALKQMKELGFVSKIFAPSTFNDPKLAKAAGDTAEGLIFSAASLEGISQQDNVKQFLAAFEKEYPDKKPSTFTAYGYDAFMILLKTIKPSGYDPTKVKDALYKMPPFYGASGKTEFDSKGDAQKELTLFRINNGEITPLMTTKQ